MAAVLTGSAILEFGVWSLDIDIDIVKDVEMKCQGRPEDGLCPDNRNDGSVHNTIGDLFLCDACEEYRRPTVSAASRDDAAPTSKKRSTKPTMKTTITRSGKSINATSSSAGKPAGKSRKKAVCK